MNKWKIHLCWTIAFSVFVLIVVITYWLGGKGNEIVSYISFASAIVSIILALVAIFYSIVQNVNSQQNIGEVRTLVSEASRLMTEKAETLAGQATSMEESIRQFLEIPTKVSSSITPLESETFKFDVPNAGYGFLLTLYYLTKCYELKKVMNFQSLSSLTYKTQTETTMSSKLKIPMTLYGLGVITCMRCFLETGSIVNSGEDPLKVEIKKLPTGFQEHISRIIEVRIQDSDTESSEKGNLVAGMKKIDAYVEAA